MLGAAGASWVQVTVSFKTTCTLYVVDLLRDDVRVQVGGCKLVNHLHPRLKPIPARV